MDTLQPDDAFLRELIATFRAEADEHIQTMTRLVLELETSPPTGDDPRLEELFRAAHSLKGAARAVEVTPAEALAHRMEDVFARIKRREARFDPSLVQAVLEAIDALGPAVEAGLREPGAPPDAAVERAIAQLDALAGGERIPMTPVAQPSPEPAVASAPELAPAPDPSPEPTSALVPTPEPPAMEPTTVEPTPGAADLSAPASVPTSVEATAGDPPSATVELSAPTEPAPAPTPSSSASAEQVRVDTGLLDEVTELAGDLLTGVRRLEARLGRAESLGADVARLLVGLRSHAPELWHDPALGPLLEPLASATSATRLRDREADIAREVYGGLQRLRLTRIAPIFDLMGRAIRDLQRSGDREVHLVAEGGDTQLDRTVLDGLRDPLLHLVRNAADHGIEPPDVREAAGKPRFGTITLRAALLGRQVSVEVQDDGAGLDWTAIREQAVERGLLAAGASPDEATLAGMLFRPGFSTRTQVTAISGRGVGLDVVRRNVQMQLGGTIQVRSTPGGGTTIRLIVPLTLATVHGLLVRATSAAPPMIVPLGAVVRTARLRPADGEQVSGRLFWRPDGPGSRPVPVARLHRLLDVPVPEGDPDDTDAQPVVLLAPADGSFGIGAALLVAEVMDEVEVVVRGFGPPVVRLPFLSAVARLPESGLGLVLNPTDLVLAAEGIAAPSTAPAPRPTHAPVRRTPTVLIVDDSVTTRTLEKHILESQGYRVRVALNGREAIRLIESEPPDLVVSDVEMPELDGIGLTEWVRAHPTLARMPVLLVTSLASDADRTRGLDAGADSYIVKSRFDQRELLATIRRLLPPSAGSATPVARAIVGGRR